MRVANGHLLWCQELGDPLRVVSGTLGPMRGWLWHLKSLGYANGDVLICIFALFLKQHVLKPWWVWTYQNSAVKHAFARVVSEWVSSWEVWFGRAKADNIVLLGGGIIRNSIRDIIKSEMGGACTGPWVASGHSLGCQEWGDPMRVASKDAGSKKVWLWRPTSPEYENEDVLICIFALFLTQRVLKQW
jgi:hypothetical protein